MTAPVKTPPEGTHTSADPVVMPADPAQTSAEAELATRLRLAVSRLNRRIRLASNDIPPLQLSTLATLQAHGPLRSGELAARESVSAPTMTRVLATLAERGLVDRAPDPSDARSVRISLSPAGVGALTRVRSERTAILGARLARLDDGQRSALIGALPALEALANAD